MSAAFGIKAATAYTADDIGTGGRQPVSVGAATGAVAADAAVGAGSIAVPATVGLGAVEVPAAFGSGRAPARRRGTGAGTAAATGYGGQGR
ncbi:hypothetical protein [Acididesulfobacillus acetoxydans]|uniref:hypothetical protein n=1 Tax=Acididesulfobacillus acetoxydans TaxID=1561005 RepID=UPI001F0E43C2|nr:hypothetical protein [Acididesulfobacillus acetoxydans]